MSVRKGMEAYTLIVVEHGVDEEVLQDLMSIEGIAEASLIYGEYDIHCKIKVDDMEQLKQLIERIRKLKIITSETFISYEKFSKRAKLVRDKHIRKLGQARTRR
jgi:DNA-binding Lrp family transcriptional regulator